MILQKFTWGLNVVFSPPDFLVRSIFWYTGQLILSKVIKTVATSCQILRLKCTKFDFGCGSAPDAAGGAYSAPSPRLPSWIKEGLLEMWLSWFWPPSQKIVPAPLIVTVTDGDKCCYLLVSFKSGDSTASFSVKVHNKLSK